MIRIDLELCRGCGHCVEVCPRNAIELNRDGYPVVYANGCEDGCLICETECPAGAISPY